MKKFVASTSVFFRGTPPSIRRRALLVAIFLATFASLSSVRGADSQDNRTRVETPFGAIVAQVSLDPSTPDSLSPIVLSAALEKPKKFRLATNDVAGRYGDFDVAVADEKSEEPRELGAERDVVVRRWTLYPKKRGTLVLPPIPLTFSPAAAPGEKEAQDVSLILPVREIVVPPRGDAPGVSLDSIVPDWSPIRRFPTLILVVSALASVLVVGALWALRRRVRSDSDVESSATETSTPSETALRRLDELKASRLYLDNDREFYPTVSAILRRYLAEEFGLSAEKKTTQEVSDFIENNSLSLELQGLVVESEKARIFRDVLATPEIRRDVERSLSAVDLVKFARRSPTFDDARQIFDATRRAVDLASRRLDAALRELEARSQNQTSDGAADADDALSPDADANQ